MQIRNLGLDGVLEITPQRFRDNRGYFCETYNERRYVDAGIGSHFIQDNQSLSRKRGVVRGLHYQLSPFAQTKLVRVLRGSIFDVAVDIRPGSSSHGRWVAVELSSEVGNQILVPAGFAHGFLTLENDTEVSYKVDAPYSASHERSIRFDDPQIGISWPMDVATLILSEKDRAAPLLKDAQLDDVDRL